MFLQNAEKLETQLIILENRLTMMFPNPVTGKYDSKYYALKGKIANVKIKIQHLKNMEFLAR